MLRTLLMLLLAVLLMPVAVSGQSYSSLWKQADEAMSKDLPQTRIEILGKIADKARRNGDYGQLMKATLGMAAQQVAVAPDSLKPIVGRLEKSRNEATDDVQRAVYSAVLSVIYKNNRSLDDSSAAIAKRYAEMAMANPALLVSAKATGYKPFVVEGINSRIFNDDMLSVIGFETEQFAPMHDYYSASGNRRAACIVALKMAQHNHRFETAPLRKSHCIVSLDSLIAVYGDLDVAGEVAVERYYHMVSCTDVTIEDQIKYINYATQKWPSWQRMNDLRNAYKRLTFPRVNVLTSGVKENTSRSVGVKTIAMQTARQLVNLSTCQLYYPSATSKNSR